MEGLEPRMPAREDAAAIAELRTRTSVAASRRGAVWTDLRLRRGCEGAGRPLLAAIETNAAQRGALPRRLRESFADSLDFYGFPYEQWRFWLFEDEDSGGRVSAPTPRT